jgi:hypothetical protein
MVIWAALYISDYTFTVVCARLYQRQQTVALEGSYELTPYFQRDIDALQKVSPRFIFALLLSLFALAFLWKLHQTSPAPELWQLVLGAYIGVQLAVHVKHVRNLFMFRAIRAAKLVHGRVEYSRSLLVHLASVEWFAFCAVYLVLFAFTRSWFILGGAIACFFSGVKQRRSAARLRARQPGPRASSTKTNPLSSSPPAPNQSNSGG